MSPELVARLALPDAGARRVTILDLIALSDSDADATAALLAHLEGERDERAALLIIRHLGRIGSAAALPALRNLYARRQTPARIAHAAIIEHDRIAGQSTTAPSPANPPPTAGNTPQTPASPRNARR